MSWLRTMVNVADLAVTVNNASQLSKMQESGQQAQTIGALRSVMREYIFQINEEKENILIYKEKSPVAVAAGLYYLEKEIDRSPVSPTVFDDISDKEYVSATLRSIRKERSDLLEHFTEDQHSLEKTTVNAFETIEELNRLSTIYDDALLLNDLKSKYKALEGKKPTGFFAAFNNDWFKKRQVLKTQITEIENQTGKILDEDLTYLVAKYDDIDSIEECEKQQSQMEAHIIYVFEGVPLSRVSIADILLQKLALPEGG